MVLSGRQIALKCHEGNTTGQGHHQRESHPANGGGNCPRTGRSEILHERRRLQSLLACASKKSRELTVFGRNTHGRLQYKRMPFGMKMSQDVFQIQMDRILEQCPGVIGIHDDVIIYGYTREDHDANLINFLNVCQMEGLCLSSKKLELRRDSHSSGQFTQGKVSSQTHGRCKALRR